MASPCDGLPPPRGVVPATAGMAARLAAGLSRDHRREIRDTSGMPPEAAVLASLAASVEAYGFAPREKVLFMMGVEPAGLLTSGAMLWMLAAEREPGHAAGMLRAARWGVARAFAVTGAGRLEQYIPEWYTAGLRFVKRLGFVAAPVTLPARSGVALRHVVLHRPPDGGNYGKDTHGSVAVG